MADASAWVGTGTDDIAADRAADAWDRICEKGTSVVIVRNNVTLDAQRMRKEYSNQQSNAEAKGGAGMSSKQRVILFGIRGHETEPDTDIQRDDRAVIDGLQFRVVSVVLQTGQVQAMCEALG